MVSVITLFSWIDNDLDMLKHGVDQVFKNTTEDFELIILDNEALPQTQEWFKILQDPRIRILHLPRRFGVPEAYNYGINQSKSNLLYVFDSDICPNRKDWTQFAREFRPQEDWGKYCFNIPYGWFIEKDVHIKSICDFYHRFKDVVIPKLNDGVEFNKEIRNRIESDVDYFDGGIVYQSYDSDMYLVCKLAGIQKLYAEFNALPKSMYPVSWSVEWDAVNGTRTKEDPAVAKMKDEYLTIKSRAYMACKWKLIRDSGLMNDEQRNMIDIHRPCAEWLEGYISMWENIKKEWRGII